MHANQFISIHALREEGDLLLCTFIYILRKISIHALREEGDGKISSVEGKADRFLSTPSARRATYIEYVLLKHLEISIHALREEGDLQCLVTWSSHRYFYPRPPRGGRLLPKPHPHGYDGFLSTPSARRATQIRRLTDSGSLFLSTPSARRATLDQQQKRKSQSISIHALREEGDAMPGQSYLCQVQFLSTPSARRATFGRCNPARVSGISIHALREEGDPPL